jgi:hypothetical protein
MRNDENQMERRHGYVNSSCMFHFNKARPPTTQGRNIPCLQMRQNQVCGAGIVVSS